MSGYRFGWHAALDTPEIERAFTVFRPTAKTGKHVVRVPRIDPDTALHQTLPQAMEAMQDRDLITFQKRLRQLETLGANDLETMLREIDPDERRFQAVFELLVRQDPTRALALANELVPSRKVSIFRSMAITRWSAVDPLGAWAAIRSLDLPRDPGPPGDYEGIVLKQWSKIDLDAAMNAWSTLPDELQSNTFVDIARNYAGDATVRDKLLSFLSQQPAGEARAWAIGGVLQTWLGQAPLHEVTSWIDRNASNFSADEIASFERKAASSAAYQNPEEAVAWLLERSGPDRRSADLEALVHMWSLAEPNATGAWLGSLELGPDTDAAVARFANTIRRDDPASAMEWAHRINDENVRSQTVRNVLSAWQEIDPDRARAFVEAKGE